MKQQSVIKVTNFQKEYKDITVTVNDLTITKRISIIIGDNGSGKSTLLKAIASLIKYKGTIESSSTYSYMPEHPHFPLDVSVIEFFNCHQLIHQYNQSDLLDLIFLFNIEKKLESKLNTLSKGMKMKVNLIASLTVSSDVYLLDEPFSGLDTDSVEKLIEYIIKSDDQFIITSHQSSIYNTLEGDVISL